MKYLLTLEESHDLDLDIRSDSINGGNACHAAALHNHLEVFIVMTEGNKVSAYAKDSGACSPFEVLGKKAKGKDKSKEKSEPFRLHYLKLMDRLG